jgi:hypothetical protein
MKHVFAALILVVTINNSYASGEAAIQVDKNLQAHYSYISEAPVLKPEAVTFLMIQTPNTAIKSEAKPTRRVQCSASNKFFTNCLY